MIEFASAGAVNAAAALSVEYRGQTDDEHKRSWGQFFTPPRIAQLMGGLFSIPKGPVVRLLDPGAGTGVLGIAAALSLLSRFAGNIHLTAVELEPGAAKALRVALETTEACFRGRFSFDVVEDDFLDLAQPRLGEKALGRYHCIIGNPPYFKISPTDERGGDAPNVYARFLEISAHLLEEDGELCFIVPRSYASGYYFRRFRRRLHAFLRLEQVHVFNSRREAFREDAVLQENIIVMYRKTRAPSPEVIVSTSNGEADLGHRAIFAVARGRVLADADPDAIISLPTQTRDLGVMDIVRGLPETLATLGLEVSTGPVVPFRAEEFLRRVSDQDTVPMLWLQHIQRGLVTWPLGNIFRKPEHILRSAGVKLLVPNHTYVLLRRFSAKEDERRIIAAPYMGGDISAPQLALENHVNFIHRLRGQLTNVEAVGLAAFLGSSLIDTYFRISSGNTQVSASELRALPLPSTEALTAITTLVSRGVSADDAVREVIGEV